MALSLKSGRLAETRAAISKAWLCCHHLLTINLLTATTTT
jgi:hypothetical protein